ncbi:MAG: thioredoxin domain-containing protein [Candidatus Berkelbacteria bacterium]
MSNKQQIIDITDRTFDEEVLKKDDKVVLLLIWNEVGQRCKNVNCELLDAIEDEKLAGKVVYRRIVGYQSNKIDRYGRWDFPTTFIFKNGKRVGSINGVRDCDEIVEIVAQHLN